MHSVSSRIPVQRDDSGALVLIYCTGDYAEVCGVDVLKKLGWGWAAECFILHILSFTLRFVGILLHLTGFTSNVKIHP